MQSGSGTQSGGMQGASGAQGRTGTQGQMGRGSGDTGADNVTYDLISIAYHALQAVQTYRQYEQDASRGDQQMAEFFRKTCDANKQCAQEALQLLQQCLGGQGMQHGSGQSIQHGSQSGQGAQGGDSGQYGRGTR
jgi:hypothetical protein